MRNLTENNIKTLRSRLDRLGKEKLIDTLENQMINCQVQGKFETAALCEAKIKWVRKQNDWVVNV